MTNIYKAIYIVNKYNNIYHIECIVQSEHIDTMNEKNVMNANEHREHY
jgi:hypothetical protein